MSVKTIGVLTSGGDAPGMNAAVRAVVRAALKKDMKVLGVMRSHASSPSFQMSSMSCWQNAACSSVRGWLFCSS